MQAPNVGSPRPHKIFDVRDLGAAGDGVQDDHVAIQSALDAAWTASQAGLAVTVRLPAPGVYLVGGPLTLNASNVLFEVQRTAVLRAAFGSDLEFIQTWPRHTVCYDPILTVGPALGSPLRPSNVTLAGGGVIDGRGWMWWPFGYHVWEFCCAPPSESRCPPYMATIEYVDGLVVANLTFLDPPMITINGPAGCTDAELYGLNITASWLPPEDFYSPQRSPHFERWRKKAPVSGGNASRTGRNGTCALRFDPPLCEPLNTDGIDPGLGSRNIHIHDIFIENGDDSIVVKPGWGADRPNDCTRDVLVENVRIVRGMGVNIGGMNSGCVQNVTFRNITLDPASLEGLQIKTMAGTDPNSFVRDVLYDGVVFRGSLNATNFPCVDIMSGYIEQRQTFEGPYFPKISNVTFKNVDALPCPPARVNCSSVQPCIGIFFKNFTGNGVSCRNADCFLESAPAPSAPSLRLFTDGVSCRNADCALASAPAPSGLPLMLLIGLFFLGSMLRRRLPTPYGSWRRCADTDEPAAGRGETTQTV